MSCRYFFFKKAVCSMQKCFYRHCVRKAEQNGRSQSRRTRKSEIKKVADYTKKVLLVSVLFVALYNINQVDLNVIPVIIKESKLMHSGKNDYIMSSLSHCQIR